MSGVGLTARQRDAMIWLTCWSARHPDKMPTLRAMCAGLGLSENSREYASAMLGRLAERGHICVDRTALRPLTIVRPVPIAQDADGAPLCFVGVPQ